MIDTVADLLTEIRDKGIKQILEKDSDITHRPTIGNIYEGLTKEMLDKALFKGLNIKVVLNSFIYNDSGKISDEMDCMVVVGDGQQISFTDSFKYHVADVIAVIQVKKKLYADDIDNAFDNLRSVKRIAEPRDAEKFVGNLHVDAYEAIVGKRFPDRERVLRFTDRENLIYHYLMMEAFWPVRIVFGFFGYIDEYALREGLIQKLERNQKQGKVSGYGPGSWPNIIICGENCIVKNNGMPFGIPLQNEEFYFHFLVSMNSNSILHMLDLIWTRLSYKFSIPPSKLFTDHLKLSTVHRFMSAKEKKIGNEQWGWEFFYHGFQRKELLKSLTRNTKDWKPHELTDCEASIISYMIAIDAPIPFDSIELQNLAKEFNVPVLELIGSLIDKRLIYHDEDHIGILIRQPVLVTYKDKIVVGDNFSGHMSMWIEKMFNGDKNI